jgi:hypothetical protein
MNLSANILNALALSRIAGRARNDACLYILLIHLNYSLSQISLRHVGLEPPSSKLLMRNDLKIN